MTAGWAIRKGRRSGAAMCRQRIELSATTSAEGGSPSNAETSPKKSPRPSTNSG